jgi:amino acid adenylation domain-containing protein
VCSRKLRRPVREASIDRPARHPAVGGPAPGEGRFDLRRNDTPSSALALVDRAVAELPDEPAVEDAVRSYTFAELDAAASAVAYRLADRWGVCREDVVLLVMEPSFDFVACMLGVLRSGAAYLPVDPAYPRERIELIRVSARTKLQLADSSGTRAAPGMPFERLAPLELDPPAAGWIRPEPGPDDAAYLIFTSGSTGRPKGIVQTHRCLGNFVAWQVEDSGLGCRRRVMQFAPLAFDVSVQEILYTLASGGCLVLTDAELRRDPVMLTRFVAERAVEVVDLPPSLIQLLLELPRTIEHAPALAHVISAGEPLRITPELRRVLERRPDLSLHNHYGPAETHMLASHTMSAAAGNLEEHPPVGRQIRNMRAYVLDEDGRPVPDGEPGEVYIAGAGVARGYTDPALDVGAFVPDPSHPGERMFRSRDRGRLRSDGALEIHGRLGDMVKVRGYRVEPREVEARLAEHPAVRGAAVFRGRTAAGRDELQAAVVAARGRPAGDELRAHLARTLPSYMLPARWWRVEELPRSPNGKVDRARLPGAGAIPIAAGSGGRPALGTTEEAVAGVWQELLGLDALPRDQDLFDLGCDSLTAVRGLLRVAERTGAELRLRDLYEAPTVAGLAAVVDSARKPAATIAGYDVGDDASSCQRGIWLACQRSRAMLVAYSFAELFQVGAGVTSAELRAALDAIVERHEALRTTWREVGAEPTPVLLEPAALEIEVLSAGTDALTRAREAAATLLRRPFDLARDLPVRAQLLVGEGDGILVLVFHHLAMDAWSTDVLERELNTLLAGAELGPPPVQYRQFARWQRDRLTSDEGRQRVRAAAARLAGTSPVALPAPDSPAAANRPAHSAFTVEVDAAQRLADDTRNSLATVVAAAFAVALAAMAGRDELVFGTTVAGRAAPGLDRAVGPYADLAPMRLLIERSAPFHALLSQAREAMLACDEDQMIPYLALVDALRADQPSRTSALLDVGVQLAPAPAGAPRDRVRRLGSVWPDAARFALWLAGVQDGDSVRFTVEHDATRVGAAAVDRLISAFREALVTCVDAPGEPVGELLPLAAGQTKSDAMLGLRL